MVVGGASEASDVLLLRYNENINAGVCLTESQSMCVTTLATKRFNRFYRNFAHWFLGTKIPG